VATIILDGDRVFIARRPMVGELAGLWEFPGGKVEDGESDGDALMREFAEEFGSDLSPIRLLGECSFTHKGRTRRLAAWLCAIDYSERLLPSEHLEIRWVDAEELVRLDLVDSDRKVLSPVLHCLKKLPYPHS
jgi:mutator protein MutT